MKKTTTLTFVLLVLSFSSYAALDLPQKSILKSGFNADYNVNYNGIEIGASKRALTIVGNKATFKASTIPEGLAAALISETATELSDIRITKKAIQPLTYTYTKDKKGKIEKIHLKFDWDKKLLGNDHLKNETELKDNTHDLLSFQLNIIRDLENNKRTMKYYVATKGHTRLYTLKFLEEEEISTDIGDFKTLKLETNTIKDKSKFTFWCAPKLGYLPIKIEKVDRKGTTVGFVLRDFSIPK